VDEDRLRALEVAFSEFKGALTAKLDAVLAQNSAVVQDHENRLRTVERKVWTTAGWMSGAAVMISLTLSYLLPFFGG